MINKIDKDIKRMDRSEIVRELELVGATIRGTSVKCPYHDDKTPSAGIFKGDDRVWRFKCQSCGVAGDVFDLISRRTHESLSQVLSDLGATSCEKTGDKVQPKPVSRIYYDLEAVKSGMPGKVTNEYKYTNPSNGHVDLLIWRMMLDGKKTFRQLHQEGDGWIMQAPQKPWPLYNRARVADAPVVIVVEGEKCVHALHDIGIVATTSPGGSKNAANADWSPLAGKSVVLWPDNDEAGKGYMRDVSKILETLDPAPTVRVMDIDDMCLEDKEDVADIIELMPGISPDQQKIAIEALIEDKSVADGAGQEVKRLIEDTIDGKRMAIPFVWHELGTKSKALFPGTVTLICGDPGDAKSFFILQTLAHWHSIGVKACCLELEEDRKFHVYRALSQRIGDSSIMDDDWVRDNPTESMSVTQEHRNWMDSFGKLVFEVPDKQQLTHDDVIAWMQARAKEGHRVICIDPITAIEADDKPWKADQSFMFRAKAIVRQYQCSLILVTHPKKGRGKLTGLDELAGGAAYQRFSQTVLWIQRHHPSEDMEIDMNPGRFVQKVNRTIRISKARNSIGGGKRIAYTFSGKTLCFKELGLVRENE